MKSFFKAVVLFVCAALLGAPAFSQLRQRVVVEIQPSSPTTAPKFDQFSKSLKQAVEKWDAEDMRKDVSVIPKDTSLKVIIGDVASRYGDSVVGVFPQNYTPPPPMTKTVQDNVVVFSNVPLPSSNGPRASGYWMDNGADDALKYVVWDIKKFLGLDPVPIPRPIAPWLRSKASAAGPSKK